MGGQRPAAKPRSPAYPASQPTTQSLSAPQLQAALHAPTHLLQGHRLLQLQDHAQVEAVVCEGVARQLLAASQDRD